ncbi:hypothetical protein VT84_37415 [Gemmata sp. SH-PL17]|uniref:hypothetical protein n=1 Tax=Gemmata sp. SH-PL17 TaxID=1630693 RepID=UPI00078E8D2E|nr:hypothetical protein [Gemmata sp. SH-PL17]AMV30133.1 hypothetical protein VT84_37415 [Gemmata sp. SH-PL17]
MSLVAHIHALRDQTLAELNAVFDYFYYSELAWGLAGREFATNPAQSYQNSATGTTVSGAQLVALAADYTGKQLLEATFQQFLSTFEVFIGDLLRLWLTAHPRAIGGKTVELKDALDAGDLATLIARLVDHEVAEVTYKSPRTVFQYLERRIGLPLPTPAEIDQLAEAKATRDVIVHNRGAVDAGYLFKAGALARFASGQRVDIPKPYHRAAWVLVAKLVTDIANAAVAKVP